MLNVTTEKYNELYQLYNSKYKPLSREEFSDLTTDFDYGLYYDLYNEYAQDEAVVESLNEIFNDAIDDQKTESLKIVRKYITGEYRHYELSEMSESVTIADFYDDADHMIDFAGNIENLSTYDIQEEVAEELREEYLKTLNEKRANQ